MKEINSTNINNEMSLLESLSEIIVLLKQKEDSDLLMSKDISHWATAFCKAQPFIENVVKTKKGLNYKYADLAAVLENSKTILSEYGLCFTQLPRINKEGKVELVTMIIHSESGQFIKGIFPVEPIKIISKEGREVSNPVQQLGSAFAYARRYSALSMLGIAQEDDDGQMFDKKITPPKNQPEPCQELKKLCLSHNIDPREFTNFHKITSNEIESVNKGIQNFALLKEEFLNANTYV